jgi:hypothetical protein
MEWADEVASLDQAVAAPVRSSFGFMPMMFATGAKGACHFTARLDPIA